MSELQILVMILSILSLIINSIILIYFLFIIRKDKQKKYNLMNTVDIEKAPSYEEMLINDDYFH